MNPGLAPSELRGREGEREGERKRPRQRQGEGAARGRGERKTQLTEILMDLKYPLQFILKNY